MTLHLKSVALLFLLLVLSISSAVQGQTDRSSIRGTITDPNGAVIPGASVRIVNSDTNESRTVLSGESGEFTLTALKAGPYGFEVTYAGFERAIRTVMLLVNTYQRTH